MKNAPIVVWIRVFIIAAFFVVMFSFFSEDIGRYFSSRKGLYRYTDFKKELAAKGESSNHKTRILIIGSSLTQDALLSAAELEAVFEKKYNIKTSIIKYNGGGKGIEYLMNQGFLRDILVFKPNMIILQESCFFNKLLKIDNEFYLKYHLRSHVGLSEIMGKLLGIKTGPNRTITFTPDKEQLALLISKRLSHLKSKGINKKNIHSFVNTLKLLDSKLMILNIPRPYPIEKELSDFRNSNPYIDYWYWCKNVSDFAYLNTEDVFTFEHFYDAQHMNSKGQQLYVDWFSGELATYILKH